MNEQLDTKAETQVELKVAQSDLAELPAIKVASDAPCLTASRTADPLSLWLIELADNTIALGLWVLAMLSAGVSIVMPSILKMLMPNLPANAMELKWQCYTLMTQGLWIRWLELLAGMRWTLLDYAQAHTDWSGPARIATVFVAALIGHVVTNRQLPPVLRAVWLLAIIASTAFWVPVPIFLYVTMFVRVKLPLGKTASAILDRMTGMSSGAVDKKLEDSHRFAAVAMFIYLLPLIVLLWKLIAAPDLITAVLMPGAAYLLFCNWNHWRWHKELSRLLTDEQAIVWREVPVKLHRAETIVWIKGNPERYYIRYAFASHGKMPSELRDREDDSPGVMQVCFRRSDKKPLSIKLVSGAFPLTRSGFLPP